jgi:preprotein translocase SecE subunit
MAQTRRRKRSDVSRELDPVRWTYVVFALGGFMAAWVLANVIEDGWAVWWSYQPAIGRPSPFLSRLAAIGVALVATVVAVRRAVWFEFVTEVVVEISQVTWPTRAEVRAATIVVIMMTLICSAILAGMDSFWSTVTDTLYGG